MDGQCRLETYFRDRAIRPRSQLPVLSPVVYRAPFDAIARALPAAPVGCSYGGLHDSTGCSTHRSHSHNARTSQVAACHAARGTRTSRPCAAISDVNREAVSAAAGGLADATTAAARGESVGVQTARVQGAARVGIDAVQRRRGIMATFQRARCIKYLGLVYVHGVSPVTYQVQRVACSRIINYMAITSNFLIWECGISD
ncbi:hypothetical protein FB45DRAFT_997089 [Roridomyces roridus]|uniref:Uncharacterized protein n=1 Tax=Roridomyces roridus TaxID=1738132 RepID=A0AAD7CI38_9AGAR|nr:hypothetical protein FB45DRAFT_997089 [Roridomyces roridus]